MAKKENYLSAVSLVNTPPLLIGRRRRKNIRTLDDSIQACPNCNAEMKKSFCYIPVSSSQSQRVRGRTCNQCARFYISNHLWVAVYTILYDNDFADEYSLNDQFYFGASRKVEEQLQARRHQSFVADVKPFFSDNKSLFAAALLKHSSCPDMIIFFSDSTNNASLSPISNQSVAIVNYRTPFARELLAKVLIFGKDRTVELNNQSFVVSDFYGSVRAKEMICYQSIRIKKGGGLYQHWQKDKNNSELIDLLLYSPYTKRYEILQATHKIGSDIYYSDCKVVRNFIHTYGNPQVNFVFLSHKPDSYFRELNEESILFEYGYNVDRNTGLSSAERHELLSEIIDLDICTQSDILFLLDMFIKMHPDSKYALARDKWLYDMNFVRTYNYNPSRFLIVPNSRQ